MFEERLAQLECRIKLADDRSAIKKLIFMYAYFFDTRQFPRVAPELFAEDAVIDYGHGEFKGMAAINEFFMSYEGAVAQTAHVITNVLLEVDRDSAKGHVHVTAWHWLPRPGDENDARLAANDIAIAGSYQDTYTRTPQGWRISSRHPNLFGIAVGDAGGAIRDMAAALIDHRPSWPA